MVVVVLLVLLSLKFLLYDDDGVFFLKHKFLGNVSEVCTSLDEYGFV